MKVRNINGQLFRSFRASRSLGAVTRGDAPHVVRRLPLAVIFRAFGADRLSYSAPLALTGFIFRAFGGISSFCANPRQDGVSTSFAVNQLIGVESVVLHRVRIPLVEPFRISNGTVAEKDSILVELTTEDGVTGWGEASPMSGSFYSADTPESCWRTLHDEMIPRLFELGKFDPHRLYEQLTGEAF